jgi:non-ribosomal peptide synthetase component F
LNIYGSSEVTADVSCYDTSIGYNEATFQQSNQPVPIGKPISNTTLYLLDKNQQPVATGITGEIVVGGVQVAKGYLHLPELTAERFIDDSFSKQPGAKLFRTGDYGRLLDDGNIVYLGRIDGQVKIRGNRVELGEIETVLRHSELVDDCVVVAKEDSEGNYEPDWLYSVSSDD